MASLARAVVPPWRPVAAVALLLTLLCVALSGGLAGERSSLLPTVHAGASSPKGLTSLPLPAQGPVSAALGADDRAYRVSAGRGGFSAVSPAQRLRERFGRTGVHLSSGAIQLAVGLRAVGYGSSLQPVGSVTPGARANRVLYPHAGLSEWYANGPLGVEQGFTLQRAPSGDPAEPLRLSLALAGNAHATLASGGQSITLGHPGAATLRYGALSATDARGRTLHSWLELHSGRVLIVLDTRGARYPLRIDPLIQQGKKLEGGEESEDGEFGRNVAMSADGNTAIVGGPGDGSKVGAAWVFTRSEVGAWTQQEKLTSTDESGAGEFGRSVALSSDGNTAVIGGPGDNGGVGAAWVFTRSESGAWTQQEKLKGSGETGNGEFGFSVALAPSEKGEDAVIGGPGNEERTGAAWVFVRKEKETTWAQQALITGKEATEKEAEFGYSVALSPKEGDLALIGGPRNKTGAGAAWVYLRKEKETTWGYQATLTGEEATVHAEFGKSVAISAEGTYALVGGPGNKENAGAAWVLTRSGTTWTYQATLTPKEKEESDMGAFGSSVALSSDGDTALIGGPGDNEDTGAAWTFARSSEGVWAQEGVKLTAKAGEESEKGAFGSSLALSSDGYTALIGGPADGEPLRGAAWAFVNPPTVSSVSPGAGPTAGETSVTITGTNLSEATAVRFGSTSATSFEVISPTSITAVSPAEGAGTVDVSVTTSGGTSETGAGDKFSYVPPPTVTEVSPNKGPLAGGTSVTITGKHLNEATAVKFGSTAASSVTADSETSVTAVAPAGTGTVNVTVSTPGGTSGTGSADQFSYVPAPTVASVSPGAGPTAGGTSVTITGTNLSEATAVKFGSTAAVSVTADSATSITAVSPAGTGVVDVSVSTSGGTSKMSAADEFSYVALPTVTEVSPDKGPTAGGTSVTITGKHLNEATAVKFGSTAASSVTADSETSVTAVAPAGTGTVNVTVSTPGGTSGTGSADQFSYVPAPTVASVSPGAGPTAGGTSVTITGTNLSEATAVKFGSTAAVSVTADSATSITAVSPAGTGVVDVSVSTSGGTSKMSAADEFSYVALPTVTEVSPDKGPTAGGTSVTITGKHLNEATAVKFGSTAASSVTADSETSITAVAPAGTGTVDVTVSTPGGVSATNSADRFSYVPLPTITKVSPDKGPTAGGTSVTITGS